MRIKCPKCGSGFNITDGWIPADGALMSCPRCASGFLALPDGLTMLSGSPGEAEGALFSANRAHAPCLPEFEIGETLQNQRFEIRDTLGQGGYGAVFRVYDRPVGVELALKIVVIPDGKDPGLAGRLAHEFRLREKISDRTHILSGYLPMLDEYKGLNLLLLPMELATGGSLRNWLQANPNIDARQKAALAIFSQVCRGVSAIHAAGLAHLDLKPENILFADGAVKISDFGLSRDLANLGIMDAAMLRDGMGTACYMAPEQVISARPSDVDHLADIYALGCILCELLDGSSPYAGTARQIFEKHEKGVQPKLSRVGETQAKAIRICLARDHSYRFQSVTALIDAIESGVFPNEPPPGDDQAEEEALKQLFERFDAYRKVSSESVNYFANVQRRVPDALALLKHAALKGNHEAEFKLGLLHFFGHGTEKDPVEAFRLFSLSAEGGHCEAYLWLGDSYRDGQGIKPCLKTAAEKYRRFDKSPAAVYKRALSYVHSNQAMYVALLVEAAEIDSAPACWLLSHENSRSGCLKKDPKAQLRWLEKAAKLGDAFAQYQLGQYQCLGYLGGSLPEIRPDRGKGLTWLEKAAAQGEKRAAEFMKKEMHNR